jgi:hypothetical protein
MVWQLLMLPIRPFLEWSLQGPQEQHLVCCLLLYFACNGVFNLLKPNVKNCMLYGRMNHHQSILNFLCFQNAGTDKIGFYGT